MSWRIIWSMTIVPIIAITRTYLSLFSDSTWVAPLTVAYREGFVVQYFEDFVKKVVAVGVPNGHVAAADASSSLE